MHMLCSLWQIGTLFSRCRKFQQENSLLEPRFVFYGKYVCLFVYVGIAEAAFCHRMAFDAFLQQFKSAFRQARRFAHYQRKTRVAQRIYQFKFSLDDGGEHERVASH